MAKLDDYPFLKAMQDKAGNKPSRRGFYMTLFAVIAASLGVAVFIGGYSGIGIFIGLGLLGISLLLALQVYGLRTKARLALVESIDHFGDFDTVASRIESDFSGQSVTESPFAVGKEWFCYVEGKVGVVCPLVQCVWAYGDAVDITVSALINRPQISIWTREGWQYDLEMEQYWVDKGLQALAAAAPWMPIGYNCAMRDSWNADRKELIALVDRARAEQTSFAAVCPDALRTSVSDRREQQGLVSLG